MCLPGGQVDRSRCRWSERGSKGVIAHGEILSIIPECSDRVSIVVVHHKVLIGATATTGVLNELVHQAMIECQLLGQVVVILVTGEGLGTVKSGWIGKIGIVIQQEIVQPID